jgi:lipoyl-dependent peroxiredoxin
MPAARDRIVHDRIARMQPIYTTTALATGDGRNGHTATDDGVLDVDVRIPKEMGGAGGATNPEQLFAAGYAACFHSALKLVAGQQGVDVTGTEVSATVAIGMLDAGGFGLAVELDVHVPAADEATAQALALAAHDVCPYSNATRGNVDVKLSVV